MGKIKVFLTTIAVLLCSVTMNAHDFEVDGIYYKITSSADNTVSVTYEGSSSNSAVYTGSIVIPSNVTYNGSAFTVKSIGSEAFSRCSSLTSVTIPNSVTSIGSFAFFGCSSLTSVTIPNSVTSISDDAFSHCSSLTSVTIPNSVTSIGPGAFGRCSSLTSVTIPNSVTSIGRNAFYGCSSLTSVTIPNSVTSIGAEAFNQCFKLSSVHISDIAAWCNIKFEPAPFLFTNAVHLYMNGKEITELIIPDGVTSIGNFAFDGCSSLTSVTIPNSVASIGSCTFRGCSNIKYVNIGNGVSVIGPNCFAACKSLISLAIPSSVKTIWGGAFFDCDNLQDIYAYPEVAVPCTKPDPNIPEMFSKSTYNRAVLHVHANSIESYSNTSPWCNFANIQVLSNDIVVNVPEGDIAAAVEAEKAKVAKVGKITINLTEGAAYTVNSSIVAPAALVINGNGATVDATALDAPFIALSKEPTAELINNYYRVDSVMISNVRVDSIKNSIFYDNGTQYCVVDFTIDNSVLNLATTAVQNEALVSFKQGGAKDVNIKNSTIYGNGVAKYFIRYNNSARLDRYGFDKNTEFQTMNYQNNTFYNVIQAGGQWGNYGGIGGQNFSKFDVQKNIWYNCGTNVIRRMAGGRFSGNNPMTFAKNTYFYNDADNSAVEASYDNSGDILTSNPGFKDAANGDFTLGEASEQNVNKTGDPRWFFVAPAPSVAYLCGATTAPDEAIYNALVAAQYDVTPLNYDDVTLTEEIVMNDFAGKYDVVVLAGATGSLTNLAKSANILLGKVNVLSTKSFWYKHYGTNGGNPGTADAPSLSVAVSEGYAEHPLFTGIDGAEFAVFNDMGKSTGRYLQSNGSFADEAYAQTTIATTLGADCIGEAWAGDYGYVIIPVDGAQPEGYLTEDGKKLFVNAVQYLIDGVKFNTGIDGINSNVNVQNDDVYSINGIKVRKAGESLKGLAKGLYIVNGKKFIVK